jgi:predicted nucleic acid-binding protein
VIKISSILTGVSKIYLDAAPLVYYVEENPTYVKRMDAIIEQIEKMPIQAFSSVILLPEVLMLPTRLGKTELVKAYKAIMFNSRQFQLTSVSLQTAVRATDLRAKYNLRTPDAIHMATALELGCELFLTNDNGLKRVSEIQVLILDEVE